MSVQNGILSLLAAGPRHGYQLRQEFEVATGHTWPVNVGQVYTTLARLERDGLVEPAETAPVEGRVAYRITDTGRAQLLGWFDTPTPRGGDVRDELTAKIAFAIANDAVDAPRVLLLQRAATIGAMQELTRRKRAAVGDEEAAMRLVLDSQLFHAEAEIRWLDHCLGQLPPTPTPPASNPEPTS